MLNKVLHATRCFRKCGGSQNQNCVRTQDKGETKLLGLPDDVLVRVLGHLKLDGGWRERDWRNCARACRYLFLHMKKNQPIYLYVDNCSAAREVSVLVETLSLELSQKDEALVLDAIKTMLSKLKHKKQLQRLYCNHQMAAGLGMEGCLELCKILKDQHVHNIREFFCEGSKSTTLCAPRHLKDILEALPCLERLSIDVRNTEDEVCELDSVSLKSFSILAYGKGCLTLLLNRCGQLSSLTVKWEESRGKALSLATLPPSLQYLHMHWGTESTVELLVSAAQQLHFVARVRIIANLLACDERGLAQLQAQLSRLPPIKSLHLTLEFKDGLSPRAEQRKWADERLWDFMKWDFMKRYVHELLLSRLRSWQLKVFVTGALCNETWPDWQVLPALANQRGFEFVVFKEQVERGHQMLSVTVESVE